MNRPHWTKEELLAKLRNPEKRNLAFAYLFPEFRGLTRKLILADNGTEMEADDVLQKGLEILNRHFESGRGNSIEYPVGFFNGIVKKLWSRKREQQRRFVELQSSHYEDSLDSPEAEYLAAERNLLILQLLKNAIGELCRKILLMQEEDFSLEQIAQTFPQQLKDAKAARDKAYDCRQRMRKYAIAHPEELQRIGIHWPPKKN